MLTKEERKAIAERFMSYDGGKLYFAELFKCLFGREIPRGATTKYSAKTVIARLIDLCDVSNMIELPLDKDGEVIHIGDTVFDGYGSKWVVNGIDFKSNGVLIDVFLDGECTKFLPYELTHKQPATIQDLSERMQGVLEDYLFSVDSDLHTELVSIADQLKELAGEDD
jgi:hypothetical protein|nr:MAG TPA: hypothetical protein [Bacteriophage sp.]